MRAAFVLAVLSIAGGSLADPIGAASEVAVPPRPRTCLVLSGGGARGAAHVGVLRVLDELRIPVDCVVGTSMGAVVGGLFASGLSPERLDRVLGEADWRDLFSDGPPRRDIPFRRKQDDNLPLFRFEFGLKRRGLVLPAGLVAGQKLDFLLKVLALPAAGVGDFDRLALPFRAVATDLTDGSTVVLASGNLADSIRASMAVPGAFTPVEIEGRTLVDGGIVANLPVAQARELGADRILAIDVSMPLGPEPIERSVVGVAIQTINVLTEQNLIEQRALLGDDDLLLRPDLGDVESTDFARVPEIVEIGADAARSAADELRRFAVPEDEYLAWRDAVQGWRADQEHPVRIDSVEVAGMRRIDPRIVTRRVATRPGDTLDVDRLADDLTRVYRLGDFERVEFRLSEFEEGAHTLLTIDAEEKSWGPNFVRFGMSLQADFETRGEFSLLADFTRTRVNPLGAEWKTRVSVGQVNGAFTEFYQPLDYGGYWFVAPRAQIERRAIDVAGADGTVDELRVDDIRAGFDLGIQFSNYGELRGGIRRGRVRLKDVTLLDSGIDRIDTGAWTASLVLDRIDNANFPRWGSLFDVEATFSRETLSADDVYDRVEATFVDARSFGRNTFVARLRWGTGLGSDVPFYDQFRLGGFLNLSGLRPGALTGPELALGQIVYYRQIGTLPGALGGGLYLGLSAEAGNVWASRELAELSDLRPAGLVWAGLDSVFGPIYVGYGRTDGSEDSFYFALGQAF